MRISKDYQRAWSAALLAGLLIFSGSAFSANWLQLQGTEPEGAEQLGKVWGFVQVQYQDDSSDPNPAGGFIPPKTIGPNLETQSAFNVNRARIGVRGVAMPIDQKINYFVLLELGN
ncbi:MAG: porin, partial [Gammaproteobacteria bacterium]|nr:porin [Gammaproteobacteria bacterium]